MGINTLDQGKNIESIAISLTQELARHAPAQVKKSPCGPHFLKNCFAVVANTNDNIAEEDDDGEIWGELVLEKFLSLGYARSHKTDPRMEDIAKAITAFLKDEQSHKPAKAAPKLGQKQVITQAFNQTNSAEALYQSIINSALRDLPARQGLERWIAYYRRKMYALRKHAAPELAA